MAATVKQKKNLKPFKKGKDERRNLKGGPKKLPSLEKILVDVLGDENDPNSEVNKIIKAVAHRAKFRGGDRAVEILLGYGYGRPKQTSTVEIVGAKEEIAGKFPFGK